MATVQKENIGTLHDKISVKLSKEDYMPGFEKALKNYGKNAAIPGFRKGHVPTGMIKKMYGPSVFVDEVLRTANKELDTYLKAEKPNLFAQPVAMPEEKMDLDINNPSEYTFHFGIGLKPEVKVDSLNAATKFTKYKIAITDDMVEAEVKNLQKRAGNVANPEQQEEDTDLIYVNYYRTDADGNRHGDATEDVEEFSKLPAAIQTQYKGSKAGDKGTLDLAGIDNEEARKAFEKQSLKLEATTDEAQSFEYEVSKIGRLTEREMSEEFFNEVFPNKEIKDEAAFRNLIKEEMQHQTQRYTSDKLQNDIYEYLIHNTKFDLPENFLKDWMKNGGEEQKTDEQVANEFPTFQHQLRWTIISDKLIGDYSVQVSREDIEEDMKQKVMSYFGAQNLEDAPWMDGYMERMMKDEKTVEETYRRLLMDKLFIKVADVATIEEKEVTDEEFGKLVNPKA